MTFSLTSRTGAMHCTDVEDHGGQSISLVKHVNPIVPGEGVPSHRHVHAGACYNGKIFIYGGLNNDDGSLEGAECFDIEK